MNLDQIEFQPDTMLYHLGPSLTSQPLPTLFYFALSGPSSLTENPYNQLITFLPPQIPIHIFSLDLPLHGKGQDPTQALSHWALEFQQGRDPIATWLRHAEAAIEFVLVQGWVRTLAVAGLSRGALVASLLAAKCPDISFMLGLAPLLSLADATEFRSMEANPMIQPYNAFHLLSQLCRRTIRLYIGNHDTRVRTEQSFRWTQALVHQALIQSYHPIPIELIITPSIGHMGHGTSPQVFQAGALWLSHHLAL
jgi:esterase FrsA